MPIPDNYKGTGYGTIYSDAEARQAIANTEVGNLIGEGGSTDPAQPNAVQLSDGTVYYKALSEGIAAEGIAGPTGGSGGLRWLSSIWSLLTSILAITPNFTKSDIFASYTRPADTVSYVASDALSNSTSAPAVLTFANVGRIVGGTGYIVNAVCYTSQTAFAGALRLHLFRGSVAPTATNDNAAYALLAANNANRIGYIDFTSFTTGGTGSNTAISIGGFSQSRLLPFACNAANSNLYGLIEVRTGFTPTSEQTFDFYLGVEQN